MNPYPPAPVLRTLADRAADHGLPRRSFLGLLGAVGGASVLAGCSGDDGPTPRRTSSRRPFPSPTSGVGPLRWGNWPYYVDQSEDGQSFPTLEEFTARTDVEVEVLEDIDDLASFYGKVRNRWDRKQDIGYDLLTFNDSMVDRCIRQGHLRPLDRTVMPNTENLLPRFSTQVNQAFDPGHRHSMPWQAGTVVLAWNKDEVPDGVRSVGDLWRPELKGKVRAAVDMRGTMGLLMWSLGTDPSGEWGDDEFGDAIDLLARQISDGQIGPVRGSYATEDLINGDAVVTLADPSAIFELGFEGDRFEWAFPEDGGTLEVDNLVVPITSERLDDAQELIDFYYDPVVAAAVSAYIQFVTPVDGVRDEIAKIDPSLVDNQMIFPSEEVLAKTVVFRPLTPEEENKYSTMFFEATDR